MKNLKQHIKEVNPPGDEEEYHKRVATVDAKFKIGYGKGKRSISDLSSSELKKYVAAREKALGQNEGVMSRHGATASDATRAKILKPYDKKTAKATKLKVKNMVSDLDHIAWQFENQFDAGAGNRGKHLLIQAKVTKSIDKIIKQLKSFDGIL